jgi:hypothetical protein
MSWLTGDVQNIVDAISALPWEKIFLLLGSIWACVTIVMTIFDTRWPMFRRHGLTYRSFQIVIGVCIVLIFLEFSGAVVGLVLNVRNVMWANWALATIIVFLAAAYIANDLRENETFRLSALFDLVIWPLLPFGGVLGYSFLRNGGWLLRHLIPGLQ